MKSLKILAFAGSIRSNSLNEHVLGIAIEHLLATSESVEINHIRLSDYDIPMFSDTAIKKLQPDNDIIKLKNMMALADGLLIATPEYNGSIPGALKNVIDWISNNIHQEPNYQQPFINKVCGIISASPSPFGAIRAALHLREILLHLKCIVMPDYISIQNAFVGKIDEKNTTNLRTYADNFISFARSHAR